MSINIVNGLANITNTQALMREDSSGRPYGELTFTTSEGEIKMTLEQFTGMYKGMVGAFPAITPVKEEVRAALISFNAATKATERGTQESAKAEERAKREAARVAKAEERAAKAKERADKATAKVAAAKAAIDAAKSTSTSKSATAGKPKHKGGVTGRPQ